MSTIEYVHGGELSVGDVVLLDAAVIALNDPTPWNPDEKHLHARLALESPFNVSADGIWTWAWEMAHGQKSIRRYKRPRPKTIPMQLTEYEAKVIGAIREEQARHV